jgi:hypothetical protein
LCHTNPPFSRWTIGKKILGVDTLVIQLAVSHFSDLTYTITALAGPKSSRRLGLPEFLDSQHMKVAMLPPLYTGHLQTPGDPPGTHFY